MVKTKLAWSRYWSGSSALRYQHRLVISSRSTVVCFCRSTVRVAIVCMFLVRYLACSERWSKERFRD